MNHLFAQLNAAIDRFSTKWEGRQVRFYPSLVGPVLFLAAGAAGYILMPSQVKIQEGTATTARTFPSLMLTLILVCSVVLILQEVIKIVRKQPIEVVMLDVMTEIRAIIILALLVLYALLIPLLGFIVASMLFGLAMLGFFRVKKWGYYLIVALSALAIGLLFQGVLNVRLP
jgi:putative tricarboxylic transport membrane protein